RTHKSVLQPPSMLIRQFTPYNLFYIFIPHPPCSTLFPYTTLFRSFTMLAPFAGELMVEVGGVLSADAVAGTSPACSVLGCTVMRSEEHTSELQSLAYLVCRLLLEKKKV